MVFFNRYFDQSNGHVFSKIMTKNGKKRRFLAFICYTSVTLIFNINSYVFPINSLLFTRIPIQLPYLPTKRHITNRLKSVFITINSILLIYVFYGSFIKLYFLIINETNNRVVFFHVHFHFLFDCFTTSKAVIFK